MLYLTRRSALAVPLAATLAPIAAFGAETPRATVEQLYEGLLGVMREAEALGVRGRYERLESVLRQTFDFPFMARLAVGSAWTRADPEQRARLADAFGRYTAAIYATRFEDYAGEHAEITGERPLTNGVIVESRFLEGDGNPIILNYLLHRADDGWRIADVLLAGTISELAMRRAEFAATAREGGAAGLIDTIERKIAELTGG